jgi:hypothetical protein
MRNNLERKTLRFITVRKEEGEITSYVVQRDE